MCHLQLPVEPFIQQLLKCKVSLAITPKNVIFNAFHRSTNSLQSSQLDLVL